MKILNLIENLIKPRIELPKKYSKELKPTKFATDTGSDSGSFSRVRNKKDDPFLIQKYSHTPMTKEWDEGFMLYAKYIIQNDLIDNIFFPKVYKIGQIVDKSGKHIDKFDIEKLSPIIELSKEELLVMFDKLFHYSSKFIDCRALASMLTDAIEFNDSDNIKDKELLAAVESIKKLLRDVKAKYIKLPLRIRLDMRSDNIMFRRTPYGPQLVISDPLAVFKHETSFF